MSKKTWLYYCIYFLIFITLTVQYKVDNQEAFRPFYTYGLLIVGLVWLISFFQYNPISTLLRVWGGYGAFGIVALLLQIFVYSIFAGNRELKDALYHSYWILLAAPVFMVSIRRNIGEYSLLVFSRSVVHFSIFSSVVSILVFASIISFDFGDYSLVQNYWTPFRLHGYLGQPTAFGGLVGFSLILVSYLSELHKIRYSSVITLFLIVVLIWSGSRSAMFALLLSYGVAYLIHPKRLSGALVAITFLAFVLILAFILLGSFDHLSESKFLMDRIQGLDPAQENSRFYIWSKVIELFLASGSFFSVFFGHGAGALNAIYAAAFNVPLQILFDYGFIGVGFYLSSIFVSFILGLNRFLNSRLLVYKLGLMLLVYGFVFNIFISSFLSPFFNFQGAALIIGILIVNLPISIFSHPLNNNIKE